LDLVTGMQASFLRVIDFVKTIYELIGLEYFIDDNEYMLCCSNSDEKGKEWRCFLRPQPKSLFGRNKAPIEKAAPLLTALKELLEKTPGINNIRWSNDYDT
jgi:hypothetical protein